MKRFKLLLVALATVSFGALTSCGGGETDDQATDTTVAEEVIEEPKIEEETPDSLKTDEVVADSTATEEVVADSTATEEAK